jgi:predicted nucleic acid-binding protein
MKTFTFFGELLKYNLSILNFTLIPENLMFWKRIIEDYRLFPTDALIAATCKHHGIRKIATFDPDFDRVDFLEVVMPE